MRFKLGSWPYPADMPAHLCWLKSPMQVGKEKHWQQKVLFQGQNGEYHEQVLPWGMVPSLKLGEVYLGGEVSAMPPVGVVKDFRLGDDVACRVTSSDFLRNAWLDRVREYRRELLWEHCVCIEGGQTRLWVPCVEIARAFFAVNKQMAYLLLDPLGLSKICSSQLEQDEVQVHFNRDVPVTILNQVLVTRIAMIRHHAPWHDSWRQVWSRSIKNPGEAAVFSQLYCRPPIVSGSVWSVRGIPSGDGFFVLEIRGIRTSVKLPFDEVTYTHPLLTYPTYGGEASEPEGRDGKGRRPRGDQNEDGEIDASGKPPRRVGSPRRGPVAVSPIKFGTCVKVFKRRRQGRPTPYVTESFGDAGIGSGSGSQEPIPVSMADEAGVGEIQAAEFKPVEMLMDVPPGLKLFIAAVKSMGRVKVGCAIKPVPDESSLAKLLGGQRHFALVHIRVLGRRPLEGYLLEIDSSDGRRVSTLVFQPQNDFRGLDAARRLLVECLANGGHWTLDTLRRGEVILTYELVKHRLLEPVRWGGRLGAKVCMLSWSAALA